MSATTEAKRHAQAARQTRDTNQMLDEIANAIEQLVKAIEDIKKALR
jgi:methyl-accepting chemotaxis protein